MKLKIKKDDLNKGLQAVQKIALNKSNNLSHENGFLIKALNNEIEMQANDYNMGIRVIIPGIIEEPGEIFISNPFLQDLIRRLPSDDIILTQKEADTKVIITGNKSKLEFLTMNPDDFDEVNMFSNDQTSLITDSITLKNLIDHTIFACSTEESRPIFMGTYIDAHDNELSMVATDTHRLALKTVTLETPLVEPVRAIVPSKMLAEISRQLPVDMPQTVEINSMRNTISFKFGNVYINTRLIEGEYPNYRRVIPTTFSCAVTVDKDEFTGAVERASIIANESQYHLINFVFDDNHIVLTSQNPDYGTVEDYSSCIMEGDGLSISFNGTFLLDILKHCLEKEISLQIKENSPLLVKEKGNDSYTCVVTPMRTR
jgi:DNA polymerase-3 subunit beta